MTMMKKAKILALIVTGMFLFDTAVSVWSIIHG